MPATTTVGMGWFNEGVLASLWEATLRGGWFRRVPGLSQCVNSTRWMPAATMVGMGDEEANTDNFLERIGETDALMSIAMVVQLHLVVGCVVLGVLPRIEPTGQRPSCGVPRQELDPTKSSR